MDFCMQKRLFKERLQTLASSLENCITSDGDWTIKGFIDVFRSIYTISTDTKVLSKVLELHLFPHFFEFAEQYGYCIELATCQNWYPDLTFISKSNPGIKFAVDLKTTYRKEEDPAFCNGFTLGSHGTYFRNRTSAKNIQYPYSEYLGHFCLCIIYSRKILNERFELAPYSLDELERIPSVISDFLFFAEEKWRIASDKGGSGNTANIGSITNISDMVNGNGVFANAGEHIFDDYWINFKIQQVEDGKNGWKPMTSFSEYLKSKNLPLSLNNPEKRMKKSRID